MRQNTLKDIFFTIVFLLLLAGAILSYSRIQMLIAANNEVTHTNTIKLKIEQLRSVISEGESAQRGYLLTNDTAIFRPYKNALQKAHLIFDDIDRLTADNPPQLENSREARVRLDNRFAFMNRIRANFNKTGNTGIDSLQQGKILMDGLRNSLLKMEITEDKLLEQRTKQKKKYESLSPLLILIFTLAILAVIIFAFRKIRTDRFILRKINDSLETKNEELVKTKNFLQMILDSSVDLVASMDTKFNYITINKRSNEILNLDPEEVIGKNVLDLYPTLAGTDTLKAMQDAVVGQTVHMPQRTGIGRPDKFFESFFIPLYENKKVTGILTISRDITELVNANKNLLSKNAELERSNEELASFNYIASHDLQEPLRKIQLFSGRIGEEFAGELPEKVLQNFERINVAAQRMRKLIEALLSYSLANRSDIEFTNTDMNVLLKEVTEQFTEEDSKQKISIEADRLPVSAPVIPAQFQQLFINLLGNAIKYSKPDEETKIKISAAHIKTASVNNPEAVPDKNYLKITVADNGIGFNRDYSHKIFGLFQRLHTKNEYTGTGIGLAICKKIMQNHGGFITATGEPGEGAVFELYFPK